MEKATDEQLLIKRSMRSVLLLSVIFAIIANVLMYSAYFNSEIVKWSYFICMVLIIGYAIPIVKLFRNRHWYFSAFIPLFWIPFVVLLGFLLNKVLPMSNDYQNFELLLVYYFILNVIVLVLGIALGMIINASLMLKKKLSSK